VDQYIGQPGYPRGVPRAGFRLPVTHHCRLPAVVKVGAAGNAAIQHAGGSVDAMRTIHQSMSVTLMRQIARQLSAKGRVDDRRFTW